MISTHTPHVGCDGLPENWNTATDKNFNSHTPCGVRQVPCHSNLHYFLFQLTHPMWGATCPNSYTLSGRMRFQLTHPMWGATSLCPRLSESVAISTHTPHVGCDDGQRYYDFDFIISTHTPHVGCDSRIIVLSLPPEISTHTPHVGCDTETTSYTGKQSEFQLTHPMWGATFNTSSTSYIINQISTHTPHVGCDSHKNQFLQTTQNFNSHTPCGVRPAGAVS